MNIYLGIDKADSHSDEFTYNNETGEVEYHPEITLDKYEQIEEGMTEETVTSILGEGKKNRNKRKQWIFNYMGRTKHMGTSLLCNTNYFRFI